MTLTHPQESRSSLPQARPGHELRVEKPLMLDCSVALAPFTIAYQTYGTLNADKSVSLPIVTSGRTG